MSQIEAIRDVSVIEESTAIGPTERLLTTLNEL
jgi:hypothetical protein